MAAGTLTMTVLRFNAAGFFEGSGLTRTVSPTVAGVGLPSTRPSASRTNAGCEGATIPSSLAATARCWGSRSCVELEGE